MVCLRSRCKRKLARLLTASVMIAFFNLVFFCKIVSVTLINLQWSLISTVVELSRTSQGYFKFEVKIFHLGKCSRTSRTISRVIFGVIIWLIFFWTFFGHSYGALYSNTFNNLNTFQNCFKSVIFTIEVCTVRAPS